MLDRPEVERCGGDFIDQRNAVAIPGEIDRLEVGAAGVAGFDPNSRILVGGVARKLLVIDFATRGTKDAAELPFAVTERAEKEALSAVTFGAEDRELREALANGTVAGVCGRSLGRDGGGELLGLRFQQGPREEGKGGVVIGRSVQPSFKKRANLRLRHLLPVGGFGGELGGTAGLHQSGEPSSEPRGGFTIEGGPEVDRRRR